MSLAKKWRLVQGQENWDGMLDPLDEDLCQELIRYAHLEGAARDNLDTREDSSNKWYGSPLFTKSTMFDKVQLKNTGYTVHKYLYWSTKALRTSTTPLTTFCGYIAVSDGKESARLGRRDVVIVFRGTYFDTEWGTDMSSIIQGELPDEEFIHKMSDSMASLEPLNPGAPDERAACEVVKIGTGWLTLYTLSYKDNGGFGTTPLRLQILPTLRELLGSFKEDEEISITVTGHSLGAAMSGLCAYDIVNQKVNITPGGKPIQVTAFSSASPKVGNSGFKEAVESMESLKILRTANVDDLVPKVPPLLLGYSDTGVLLSLDTASSKYLKQGKEAESVHNLEVYCHLISGKVEFLRYHQLELVNKTSAMLLDKYNVPPKWSSDINVDVEVDDAGHFTVIVKNIVPENPEYN